MTLPGTPGSVREARALVRRKLGASELTEAAVLAASELATNAIVHTRSGLPGGMFTVTVQAAASSVVISIGDSGSQTAPDPADPSPDAEHGRGLRIVAALAVEWGTESGVSGRVTWCRIGCTRRAEPGQNDH